MTVLLDVRNYSVGFQTERGFAQVVDDVSFQLERGKTLGIVGESGSGKSVLNRSIMGLASTSRQVEDGSVRFDGAELVGTDRQHLWGRRIGMIFQDPMTSLNPVMRIGHQIAEPLRQHLGLARAAVRDRSIELLEMVGVAEAARRLSQFPHQLSGGLRQRVLIAIALAGAPDLLVADEPTTALDVTVQKYILDLLAEIQSELAMSIVLITHDLGVARGRTDDIMAMYGGRVMEMAPAEPLFSGMVHPYTQALFAATPRVDQPKHTRLTPIDGAPPDPLALPSGCRFSPRCLYAQPQCTEVVPAVQHWSRHRYACFYPVGTRKSDEALARNAAQGVTAAGLVITERLGAPLPR